MSLAKYVIERLSHIAPEDLTMAERQILNKALGKRKTKISGYKEIPGEVIGENRTNFKNE